MCGQGWESLVNAYQPVIGAACQWRVCLSSCGGGRGLAKLPIAIPPQSLGSRAEEESSAAINAKVMAVVPTEDRLVVGGGMIQV